MYQQPLSASYSPDSSQGTATSRKLRGWYEEANRSFHEWYDETVKDYEYYDHRQYSAEELETLRNRSQPDTIINQLRVSVELVKGVFDRMNTDAVLLPRGTQDNDWLTAQGLTHGSKYVEDANDVAMQLRAVVHDMTVGGLAWFETGQNPDPTMEEVWESYVDWRDIRPDPLSRRDDYSDARYLFRVKWLDLEEAKVLFPKHKAKIEAAAGSAYDLEEDRATVAGDDYLGVNEMRESPGVGGWNSLTWLNPHSRRVLFIECWYYEHARGTFFRNRLTGQTVEVDPKNLTPEQQDLLVRGMTGELPLDILEDRPFKRCRQALMLGPHLLEDNPSPYHHGKIPFVRFDAWRDYETGFPIGLVRIMRDPQDAANKALSKLIHALATRQVLMEKNAGDAEQIREQAAKPDGFMLFERNALREGRVKIETNATDAQLYRQVFELFHRVMGDLAGGLELQGMPSNAESGRAIALRQEQGNVTLSTLFTRFKAAKKRLVELRVSNMQQFWSDEKVIRVTESLDPAQREIVVLNQRLPDGRVVNDISRMKVDVVVDMQPSTATVRQRFADRLMDLMMKLPPQVGLGLMDIVVDLHDLPNRPLIKKRVQAILQMMGMDFGGMGMGGQGDMAGVSSAAGVPGDMSGQAEPGAGYGPEVMQRILGADLAAGNIQNGS